MKAEQSEYVYKRDSEEEKRERNLFGNVEFYHYTSKERKYILSGPF
jgi:hypothetical protein